MRCSVLWITQQNRIDTTAHRILNPITFRNIHPSKAGISTTKWVGSTPISTDTLYATSEAAKQGINATWYITPTLTTTMEKYVAAKGVPNSAVKNFII